MKDLNSAMYVLEVELETKPSISTLKQVPPSSYVS